MKCRKGLLLGLAGLMGLSASQASAEVLVQYTFTGNSPSATVAGPMTGTDVVFGAFSGTTGGSPSITSDNVSVRSTQTNSAGGNNLADAISTSDYITFTIDNNSAVPFSIEKISYTYTVSSTDYLLTTYLATSVTGINTSIQTTNNIISGMSAGVGFNVVEDDVSDLSSLQNLTNPLEIRIYFSDSTAITGVTHRIDNIVIEGTPEPTSLAPLLLGGLLLLARRRRRA